MEHNLINISLEIVSILARTVINAWSVFSITVFIGNIIINEKPSYREKLWFLASIIWLASNYSLTKEHYQFDNSMVGVLLSFALSLLPFIIYTAINSITNKNKNQESNI